MQQTAALLDWNKEFIWVKEVQLMFAFLMRVS